VYEADQSLGNARTVAVQSVRRYSLAEQRDLKGSNSSIVYREKSWECRIKFDYLREVGCLGVTETELSR
jgi:hypothetical protein